MPTEEMIQVRNPKTGEVIGIPRSVALQFGMRIPNVPAPPLAPGLSGPPRESVGSLASTLDVADKRRMLEGDKSGNFGTNLGQMLGNAAGDVVASRIPGGGLIKAGIREALPVISSYMGGLAGQQGGKALGSEENLSPEDQAYSALIPYGIGKGIKLADRGVQAVQDLTKVVRDPSKVGTLPSEFTKWLSGWYYKGNKNAPTKVRRDTPVYEPAIKEVDPNTGKMVPGYDKVTETEILRDWKAKGYPALSSQTTRNRLAEQHEAFNPKLTSEIIPAQDAHMLKEAGDILGQDLMKNKDIAASSRANLDRALSSPQKWEKTFPIRSNKKGGAAALKRELFDRMWESGTNQFNTGKGLAFINEHGEKFGKYLDASERKSINKFMAGIEQQSQRQGSLNYQPAADARSGQQLVVTLPSIATTWGSAVTARATTALAKLSFEKEALSKLAAIPEFAYAAARLMELPGGSSQSRALVRQVLEVAGREGVRFKMNVGGNETEVKKDKDGKWVLDDGTTLDPEAFGGGEAKK